MTQQFHSLVSIWKEKFLVQKDTWTPVFIAALFTISKTCKQPNCPSTDEWKKMRCIYNVCMYVRMYICIQYTYNIQCMYVYTCMYNGILLNHKREGNFAICNTTDGPEEYYAKWNKSDRERHLLYDITYMWNLKSTTS